jgi:ribosome modulation factor
MEKTMTKHCRTCGRALDDDADDFCFVHAVERLLSDDIDPPIAYAQGRAAAFAGECNSDCPYTGEAARYWHGGWIDAHREIRLDGLLLRPIPAPGKVTVGIPVSRAVLSAPCEEPGPLYELIADEDSILCATAGGRDLVHILHAPVAIFDPDHVERPVPPGWYEIVRERAGGPPGRPGTAATDADGSAETGNSGETKWARE